MTPEEIQKFIEETDEGKTFLQNAINAHIKGNGFKSKDEVAGLVEKKEELLTANKKLKDERDSLKANPVLPEETKILIDTLNENDIFDIDDFKSKMEGVPKGNNPDLESSYKRLGREKKALDMELKALQQEKANLIAAFEKERTSRIASLRESVLTESLKKANVTPEAFDFAKAFFDKQIKHEIDPESGTISFTATDELSSPIPDYIADWSKTDGAKPFILQPANTGTGSKVNNTNGKSSISMSEFMSYSPEKQLEIGTKGEVDIIE